MKKTEFSLRIIIYGQFKRNCEYTCHAHEDFWHIALNSLEFRPKTSRETNLNILKNTCFLT